MTSIALTKDENGKAFAFGFQGFRFPVPAGYLDDLGLNKCVYGTIEGYAPINALGTTVVEFKVRLNPCPDYYHLLILCYIRDETDGFRLFRKPKITHHLTALGVKKLSEIGYPSKDTGLEDAV